MFVFSGDGQAEKPCRDDKNKRFAFTGKNRKHVWIAFTNILLIPGHA